MTDKKHDRLAESELNQVVAAQIKDDQFHWLILQLSATADIHHVLEIGSSAGGGSTDAFVHGLSLNPNRPNLYCIEVSKPRFEVLSKTYEEYNFVHCYNMSSVSVSEFPSEDDVTRFWRNERSRLNQYPLDEVLRWLRQDIEYIREAGVKTSAIEHIKHVNGIDNFDLVLIDGSEFTGEVEFDKIRGAKIILLDDTYVYKTWNVRLRLLGDPNYKLIVDKPNVRNGFAAFHRIDFAVQPIPRPPLTHFVAALVRRLASKLTR